jgi:hypothetical protein
MMVWVGDPLYRPFPAPVLAAGRPGGRLDASETPG